MIAIDVGAMVQTALDDRQRCRLAGVAEIHANMEASAHVLGLANRLRDRLGPVVALRAALALWDVLEAGSGNSVH